MRNPIPRVARLSFPIKNHFSHSIIYCSLPLTCPYHQLVNPCRSSHIFKFRTCHQGMHMSLRSAHVFKVYSCHLGLLMSSNVCFLSSPAHMLLTRIIKIVCSIIKYFPCISSICRLGQRVHYHIISLNI